MLQLKNVPSNDNTGIQKNWVVSDLWIDFECFEAAELKMNSISLYHVKIICNITFLFLKMAKCYPNTIVTPLNDCHSNENNFNTLNAMPRSRTCSFYADRYTTFRNVVQFLAQIAKPRSRMSHCTGRTCLVDNRGDPRGLTRQTLCRWVLTGCSS